MDITFNRAGLPADANLAGDEKHRMSDKWPRDRERYPVIPDQHGRCWHVVHSDVKNSERTCEAIKKMGYDTYYPKMREMRAPALRHIHSAKRKQLAGVARPILSPIFPGYPFVLFSLEDGQWHELFELFGVFGIKVADDLPAAVPTEIIANIKGAEIAGAVPLETPITRLLFNKNEEVRIEEGPFQGFNGTIQRLDESKRLALLELVMFGRPTKYTIDTASLSKL